MQTPVATPEHHRPLTIEPFAGTVTVRFSDAIVAATERAKVLREEGHEPVFYIPFEDIYFELFEKTNTTSKSPLKGTASYWRVHAVGGSPMTSCGHTRRRIRQRGPLHVMALSIQKRRASISTRWRTNGTRHMSGNRAVFGLRRVSTCRSSAGPGRSTSFRRRGGCRISPPNRVEHALAAFLG